MDEEPDLFAGIDGSSKPLDDDDLTDDEAARLDEAMQAWHRINTDPTPDLDDRRRRRQ